MPTYQFSTTKEQEELLSWIVDTYNKAHDAQLTNEEFVDQRFPQLLAPYAEPYKAFIKSNLQAEFDAASEDVKSQILALLKASK